MMRQSGTIGAMCAALALATCATQPAMRPSGTTVAISLATNGELAKYLRAVKVTRPGAFAVSPDGRNSFYTWCADTMCATSNYSMPALRGCQSLTGTQCVVLYVRHEPRLNYTVAQDAAPGGQHGSEQQPEIDYNDAGGR